MYGLYTFSVVLLLAAPGRVGFEAEERGDSTAGFPDQFRPGIVDYQIQPAASRARHVAVPERRERTAVPQTPLSPLELIGTS